MFTEEKYVVYILANKRNGTLYTGLTAQLPERLEQHRSNQVPGFTRKYNVKRLVHFERYNDLTEARLRERRVKRWPRKWKIDLIEKSNPDWNDLSKDVL